MQLKDFKGMWYLFIDFQFTQLFFQIKKDLAMKLWGMIKNMLMEMSEPVFVRINKKISKSADTFVSIYSYINFLPIYFFKTIIILEKQLCKLNPIDHIPPKYHQPLRVCDTLP